MNVNSVTGKVTKKVGVFTTPVVVISPDTEIDIFSNRGAAAAVEFKLPPAKVGMEFTFIAEAVQNIVLDPNGTETISLAGTAQGAGVAITGTGAQTLVCKIVCLVDGAWKDVTQRGTWA